MRTIILVISLFIISFFPAVCNDIFYTRTNEELKYLKLIDSNQYIYQVDLTKDRSKLIAYCYKSYKDSVDFSFHLFDLRLNKILRTTKYSVRSHLIAGSLANGFYNDNKYCLFSFNEENGSIRLITDPKNYNPKPSVFVRTTLIDTNNTIKIDSLNNIFGCNMAEGQLTLSYTINDLYTLEDNNKKLIRYTSGCHYRNMDDQLSNSHYSLVFDEQNVIKTKFYPITSFMQEDGKYFSYTYRIASFNSKEYSDLTYSTFFNSSNKDSKDLLLLEKNIIFIDSNNAYFIWDNNYYSYNIKDKSNVMISKNLINSSINYSPLNYKMIIDSNKQFFSQLQYKFGKLYTINYHIRFPNFSYESTLLDSINLSLPIYNRYNHAEFNLSFSKNDIIYLNSIKPYDSPFVTYSDYSSTISARDTFKINYYSNKTLTNSVLLVNGKAYNTNITKIEWTGNEGSYTFTHRYSFDRINFFENYFYVKVLKKLKADFALDRDKGNSPLKIVVTDLCKGDYTSKVFYLNDVKLDSINIKTLSINGAGEYIFKVVISNEFETDSLSQLIYITSSSSNNYLTLNSSFKNPSNIMLGRGNDILFYSDTTIKVYFTYLKYTKEKFWFLTNDSMYTRTITLNILNNGKIINFPHNYNNACENSETYRTNISFDFNSYYISHNNCRYINYLINDNNIDSNLILLKKDNRSVIEFTRIPFESIKYYPSFSRKNTLFTEIPINLYTLSTGIVTNNQLSPGWDSLTFPKSILLNKDTVKSIYDKYFNHLTTNSDFTQSKDNFILWDRNRFVNYIVATKSLDTLTKFTPNDSQLSLIGCSKDYVFAMTTLNNSSFVNSIKLNTSSTISMPLPSYYKGKAIATSKGNLILYGDSSEVPCYHVYDPTLKLFSKNIIDVDGSKATIEDIQEQKNGDFKFLLRIIPEIKINSLNTIPSRGITLYRETLKISEPIMSNISVLEEFIQIKIAPNPASNSIEINGYFDKYELLDLTGSTLQNGLYAQLIDISNLNKGIYLLKLIKDNNFKIIKLIKE